MSDPKCTCNGMDKFTYPFHADAACPFYTGRTFNYEWQEIDALKAEIERITTELDTERRWRQALDKAIHPLYIERDKLRELLARAERRINSLTEALADL